MPTIGLDCELILDGTGYFLKPGSYQMQQPRLRRATPRADGGLAYVDLGPGKRTWQLVILCFNELTRYDGTPTGLTGQQYRDTLRASYLASTGSTVLYSDPIGATAVTVHIDNYRETVLDLHTQQLALATGGPLALSYEVTIELLEG
ncbi:hypothetical protein [Tengunoibacter tsumagoiensis]|uniref:Uncharacterized protein n=1 Tax=Tengunoibacter tsumagoiensis TaxID=2014871 RepID=A0A402A2L6_9CHLR|nr:hypothetical protein [Tengunoibacter tsumagoiensis]GCE13312.1 hypothetical protein KTT_31710 [Tengunoibacter tsumagoiensis]